MLRRTCFAVSKKHTHQQTPAHTHMCLDARPLETRHLTAAVLPPIQAAEGRTRLQLPVAAGGARSRDDHHAGWREKADYYCCSCARGRCGPSTTGVFLDPVENSVEARGVSCRLSETHRPRVCHALPMRGMTWPKRERERERENP